MFSNLAVGFFAGLGFGGWVYGKQMRANGGQAKRALTVAAVAGGIGWLLVTTLLGVLFH
jgi:hypothetical protein